MTRPTADRRAHVRFTRAIEIEGSTAPDGIIARMVASDLSLGGLHCSSSSDFPVMTRLAVRLMLPHDRPAERNGHFPMDVEAVVVRRRRLSASAGGPRYELALFFTAMADADRQRLARYLGRSES